MGHTSFNGIIPEVYEKYEKLRGLILNGNQFQGEVPSSLFNCQSLTVLDLANNQLNGTFPHWLGDLPELQIFVLKSNKFHGPIETPSTNKIAFPGMRVLDLSHNEFEGLVPQKYLQNFNVMKNMVMNSTIPIYLDIGGKNFSVTTVVKGMENNFLLVITFLLTCSMSSVFKIKGRE
uniref:Leucine-rich repeat-containing N-terminal plant-type domain-containing protein n=1 Tax=Lactuca sativa TaxID=4236 RepID=A0A9R1W7S5_LACSA|nr:hypothetical protein LSAT_V11C200095800 [Lactuca sativa]